MKVSFFRIFWGLISISVGLFFLYGTWESYSEIKRIQDYNGRAIGHITNKHFQLGSDGGGNYYLDYWFMSSVNSKITATSVIAKDQWDMLKVNDTFEVRFNQSNPVRNIPVYGGSPSLIYTFFLLVLGAVFMLFGGSRIFYSFRKHKSK